MRVIPSLALRADDISEVMDSPDCDAERLRNTYSYFRYVNAVLSGWRLTYRRDIRPALSPDRQSTLLDIGTGGGDVARSLSRWARRDRLRLGITAIDPDARAHEFTASQPALPGLTFRTELSSDLVARGERFDFVISNHVLHHLSAEQLGALLVDSERLCRQQVLHSDIERSLWGYVGFGLGTWPLFRDSYIREDGLTSIRRSFTAGELRAGLRFLEGVGDAGDLEGVGDARGWYVTREVPSRLMLRWQNPGHHDA